MDNFFAMGIDCRSIISGFLILSASCLADFSSNDSVTLGAILDCVDTIKDSEAWNDSQILYRLESLDNVLGDLELEVRTELPIIKNYASGIYSGVSSVVNTLGYIYTAITDLNNPLQSIDSKIATSDGAIKVYDVGNSDVSASLHEIAVSLTNLLQNAPMAYDPAFVTNSFASSLPYLVNLPSNKVLTQYYRELFGHDPSSQDLANFLAVYRATSFLGGIGDIYRDLSVDVHPANLLTFTSIDNYFTQAMLTSGFSLSESNVARTSLQNIGRIRYYQYGTRPLIQFFESATNDYPLTGQSVITRVQTSDGAKPGFSSGFVDTVTSLASSFQIDTNIASVSTQEIVDIENPTISGTWVQAKNESPDNYALTDLSNSLQSSLAADSSSVLNVFNESGGESLDFQFPISIGSSEYQLNYTIPATSSLYRPYVAFFAAIVKGIIVMYFGLQIWENVVKEVWMGRRF